MNLEKFIIQSHRGAGVLLPENTMKAIELGWKLNTIPEVDVRMTRDGVIVLFHDKNLSRFIDDLQIRNKGVEDLSWKMLNKFEFVSSSASCPVGRTKIPELSRVFSSMGGHPSRKIYLDIKKVSFEVLAEMANRYGIEKQVIFSTTHYEEILQWRTLLRNSQTLLWMGGDEEKLLSRIEMLKEREFEGVTQLQFHVKVIKQHLNGEPFNLSCSFIRESAALLQSAGVLFQSLPDSCEKWVYQKLLELGVKSFATDYPEECWEAVREYYQ